MVCFIILVFKIVNKNCFKTVFDDNLCRFLNFLGFKRKQVSKSNQTCPEAFNWLIPQCTEVVFGGSHMSKDYGE